MTRKTLKDIASEFDDIKKELQAIKDLKATLEDIIEKYKNQEKNAKENLIRNASVYRCNICDENFSTPDDLRRHIKDEHTKRNGKFVCEVCEKTFDVEWKMNAHSKSHKSFPCDQCAKSFQYEETKEKHVTATHGNVKLYCHFFNNNKECPYNENCIFIHGDSQLCKYNARCERPFCMYKHGTAQSEVDVGSKDYKELEDKVDDLDEGEHNSDGNSDEDDNDDEVDDLDEGEVNSDSDCDQNGDESENKKKVEEIWYQCDVCEYKAPKSRQVTNHKYMDHPLHCYVCPEVLPSKTQRRKHVARLHSEQNIDKHH